MADFDKPDNLSDYANVWDYVKDVQESLALWQDGTTDTNITTGSKRYSSTNKRFETYNGTSWVPLIALDTDQANAYQIRVAKANSVDLADLATNALRLGSVLASEYVQTTDARMNNSRAWDATIDAALIATARNVLSIYSQLQINNALALKANTASPALTGAPTAPTAAAGTDTVQIATTAFATTVATTKIAAQTGAWVNMTLLNGWTATRARCRLVDGGNSLQIDIYKASGPSAGQFATIPSGYRPAYDFVVSDGAFPVSIAASGMISSGGVVGATTVATIPRN